MSKFKRVLKIILGILVISAFLVGIPIVINECYKANCGYSTAWDASAMLGYYGTIYGDYGACGDGTDRNAYCKRPLSSWT